MKVILILAAVALMSVLVFTGKISKLPGDILISKPGFTFYFPITTIILASLVISLLFWLFSR